MIDSSKVKRFWEARGRKYGEVAYESIANLEEDQDLLDLKIRLEKECVIPRIPTGPDVEILDLGAGVGQWAFRFAGKVKRVLAVEYSEPLVKIARREAASRGFNNVQFVLSAAEEFDTHDQFDVIMINGLFVYLIDAQADQLVGKLPRLLKPTGTLLLRDGTSILDDQYELVDKYSEILNECYSATYRTRSQYVQLFTEAGFHLVEDGQVFEEGCPLNKFPETRLRFYVFRLA